MTKKIIPVVVGLIKQQQLFLVAKRPSHVIMSDYWELPGGKVEPNETQFDALVREFEEELDITITQAEFLFQSQAELPDRIIELHLWRVDHYLKIPRGNEGQEIRWINAEQFSDYEFLPSNGPLLEFVKNYSISH